MNINVDIPRQIVLDVPNYEFVQELYQEINPDIKVSQLGFADGYVAAVYIDEADFVKLDAEFHDKLDDDNV